MVDREKFTRYRRETAFLPASNQQGENCQVSLTGMVLKQFCKVALMLCLLGSAINGFCANWYVRPTAQGSNNGSDWNNAWTTSTINWSSIHPGDTVWFAGGTYTAGMIPQSPGTASQPISFKRVLSSDSVPTAAAGWNSAFDSQVVISPPSGDCIGLNAAHSGDYTYWDGRIDSGIKLVVANTPGSYTAAFRSSTMSECFVNSYVTLTNIEMVGPYYAAVNGGGGLYQNYGSAIFLNRASYMTFTHCRIHGWPNIIKITADHITFDRNLMYDNKLLGDPATQPHPNVIEATGGSGLNNIIFSNNRIWNWDNEGIVFGYPDGPYWVYGNVWDNTGNSNYGRVIETYPGSGLNPGLLYFYNNTCINCWNVFVLSGSYGTQGFATGTTIRNNIYWNCGGTTAPFADYDFCNGTLNEAHGVNGIGATPFVNLAGGDYHIASTIGANYPRDKGVALANVSPAIFNVDMDGNTRGADGTWDIGAYEYPGGSSTNPVVLVTPAFLDFGTLLTNSGTNLTLTVQNKGGGILSGTATVSAPFQIVSGGTYSLGSNQSQTVTVRFSPAAAGTYNQVVTFTGGGGATATLSAVAYTKQPGLSFNSTAGTIIAPFTINGSYISQSVDVSSSGATGVTSGGAAYYGFSVPAAGDYTIAAQVIAPNAASKSFWVNVDAQPTDPTMIWDIYPYSSTAVTQTVSWRGNGGPASDQFAPKVFTLAAGNHCLVVRGRESGVQLGAITISAYNTNPVLAPTVSPIATSSTDVDAVTPGLQVFAGSTAQYSGSASDPNGYPLSWQWVYTVNGGPETVFQSGSGTVGNVSFTYPNSAAGSSYVWTLRVSNGYLTSESKLTVGVEAAPVPTTGLTFQAGDGTISAPLALNNGILSQAIETGVTNGGQAVYSFTVTNAGNYVVQMLVNAPSTANNSFYVNIDGRPQDPSMIFDVPLTAGFEQRTVGWRGNGTPDSDQFVPKVFSLAAGTHQLIIVGREANTQLQSLSVLQLPSAPRNLRVLAGL